MAAVVAYLAAVAITSATDLVAVRPLYDGFGPQAPYNWVDPPREFSDDNVQPEPVSDVVPFDAEGSRSQLVATPDGQVRLILPLGAFAPRPGQTGVRVSIEPLDPGPLPEVSDDLAVDGNAYRIEAVYEPSGEPASLEKETTMVLRYPRHAAEVGRLDGRRWELLETEPAPTNLDLFTDLTQVGTFAAIGPPPEGQGPPWWALALGGVVLAAAGFEGWRYWRRRAEAKTTGGRAGRRRNQRQGKGQHKRQGKGKK